MDASIWFFLLSIILAIPAGCVIGHFCGPWLHSGLSLFITVGLILTCMIIIVPLSSWLFSVTIAGDALGAFSFLIFTMIAGFAWIWLTETTITTH